MTGEPQPEPTVRENKAFKQKIEALEARLEKLEKATCAMLDAWTQLENDELDSYMPTGEFYGRKYE